MRKTKIIEIGTGYTSIPSKVGAATEIVVEELAKSCMKKGLDVTIFDISDIHRTPSALPIQEVYLPALIAGKVGYKLGMFHKIKRICYSTFLAFRLNRFINKNQHYILHFHNQYNFFFFWIFSNARKRKNVLLFYTNHTYTWSLPWPEIKSVVKKKYFMENYSMKKADMVFVLNENTVTNLTEHANINPSNIKLIPNGVNAEIFKNLPPGDKNVQDLRKFLQLEGKTVLFHVGTICERKNQLGIIKYLEPAFKSIPNLVFVFAGGIKENEYFAAILNYCKVAQIEKNILYAGEIEPGKILNTYYNIASSFIFFSKSEGFSLALLEAMSSGLPVLLSRNLEIGFIKAGDNGIVTFESGQEFLDQLNKEILCKPRQEYHSGRARDFVVNNYSWSQVVDKYFSGIP